MQLVVIHPGGENGGGLDVWSRIVLEDRGHVAGRCKLHDGAQHPPAVLELQWNWSDTSLGSEQHV